MKKKRGTLGDIVLCASMILFGGMLEHIFIKPKHETLIKQTGTQVEIKRWYWSSYFDRGEIIETHNCVYTFQNEEDCDAYINQYMEDKKLPIQEGSDSDAKNRIALKIKLKDMMIEWEPKRVFVYNPVEEKYIIYDSVREAKYAQESMKSKIKEIAANCDKYKTLAEEMK